MSWTVAPRTEFTLTIASGQSLSGGVEIGGLVPVALWTPAAWTAAAISFLVSRDGSTFASAYDESGAEISIPSGSIATAEALRFGLKPSWFLGVRAIQIRSGIRGAAVNQGAARDLVLVTRPGI